MERVLVDAGSWVRQGQVLAVVDRSVQAQQTAQLAAQVDAARADDDPFLRLCVEFLARTGLRKGEFLGLTRDAITDIGEARWLRTPVGKLHTDRYIPLHPRVNELLPQWLSAHPPQPGSNLMFTDRGRPLALRAGRSHAPLAAHVRRAAAAGEPRRPAGCRRLERRGRS